MGLGVGRHSLRLQSFPGGGGEKNKTNFKSSCCSRLQKRFGMLGGCKRNKANVEGGKGRPIKFLATRQETYHYHMI